MNKSLHWSLCVVVNPGAIQNRVYNDENQHDNQHDDPFPCILFFDSLKAHCKGRVALNVRKWLNCEWDRLYPRNDVKRPFQSKSMMIYCPKGATHARSTTCTACFHRFLTCFILIDFSSSIPRKQVRRVSIKASSRYTLYLLTVSFLRHPAVGTAACTFAGISQQCINFAQRSSLTGN